MAPAELTRDPRARRAARAALAGGFEVVGLCGQVSREPPAALEGVAVHRVGSAGFAGTLREAPLARGSGPLLRELRGLYRLARLAALSARLGAAGRRLGRFDVVHANDLDALPGAWLVARGSSARLVYDAHELYSLFEREPPRLYRAVSSALEGFLARRADAVVTVSGPLAEELRQRLRLPHAPLVVHNCPELVELEPQARPDDARLGVVYQGTLGPGRDLADLLRVLGEAPSIELTLRIPGLDSSGLEGRERLHVAEPVPPDRTVESLRSFDAGVVFDRPLTRNSELSFPNKLFEYLMAGLAVVVPALPAMGPFVEAERVGLTFAPGRPDELARALERLAHDRELLRELRHRARALAVERYNAERQVEPLRRAWGVSAGL